MLLGEVLHRWTACRGVNTPGPCRLASGDGWLLLGLLLCVVCAVYAGRRLVARHEKLSDVGSYPITVALGSNPNYDVSKTDDTLAVGKKTASVSADHKEKTYGDDNPALTATVTGAGAPGTSA